MLGRLDMLDAEMFDAYLEFAGLAPAEYHLNVIRLLKDLLRFLMVILII